MKSNIKYILFGIMPLCLFLCCADMEAKRPRKSGKGEEKAEAPAPVKKTPYEKFVSGKGMLSEKGFMTIYRSGKDIWLEVPDSIMGRKLLLTGMANSSSSPFIGKGMKLSSDKVYEVARTDSMLVFRISGANTIVSDSDPDIAAALNLSKAKATVMAFPIKYRNADSTACVVKATRMFDHSNKDLVSFKGHEFNGLIISSADRKSDLSVFKGLTASENNVGVKEESTFDLTVTIPGFGFESAEKPKVTVEITSSLVLLPEDRMPGRKSDSRIGTRTVSYTSFDSRGQTKDESWACRWNLSGDRKVKVYVDTLLPASWQNAVKEGLEKWNNAFRHAGLGDKVEVGPYPSSGDFDPDSPLVSVVTCSGSSETKLSATLVQDSSTGEIMSIRMMIPGEYVLGVRRTSLYTISDVDPRYQKYDLEDSAVCEVLASESMSLFGRCLGLLGNAAGSVAYSPEQLRDPAFTAEHGITSSVTDNVRFNYFARPGDRERGLVIISDRLGEYDRYAIEWLYGDFAGKSPEALDSLVSEKAGMPEYLYLPASGASFDSRVNPTALGNDIFAAYEAGMSHLKFVAENASGWLDDSLPESYIHLFLDFLWLKYRDYTNMLRSYIGAVNANEIRDGYDIPKMTTYPASVQKKAIAKIFESYTDLSWIDRNMDLVELSGANKGVGRFTRLNSFILSGAGSRLAGVAMAERMAGGDYTPAAYLKDIQDVVLKNARKGRLASGEDVMIGSYLQWLMSNSDVMTRNYKKATDPAGGSSFSMEGLSDEFRTNVRTVPSVYSAGLEELCWLSMQRARTILAEGMAAAKGDYDRKCLKYLLSMVDAGLGNL